jgi:hypothetical protein
LHKQRFSFWAVGKETTKALEIWAPPDIVKQKPKKERRHPNGEIKNIEAVTKPD